MNTFEFLDNKQMVRLLHLLLIVLAYISFTTGDSIRADIVLYENGVFNIGSFFRTILGSALFAYLPMLITIWSSKTRKYGILLCLVWVLSNLMTNF